MTVIVITERAGSPLLHDEEQLRALAECFMDEMTEMKRFYSSQIKLASEELKSRLVRLVLVETIVRDDCLYMLWRADVPLVCWHDGRWCLVKGILQNLVCYGDLPEQPLGRLQANQLPFYP